MPNRMDDLVVEEVSGVDRAANLREFIVRKSADSSIIKQLSDFFHKITKGNMFNDVMAENKLDNQMWGYWYPLENSMLRIMADAAVTDKKAELSLTLDQFMAALVDKGIMTATAAAETTKSLDLGAHDVIAHTREVISKAFAKEEKPMPDAGAAPVAELQKRFEDVQKELENIKKAREDEKVELQKRLDAAENIVKFEQTARLQKEAENFVTNNLNNMPGDKIAMAGMIKLLRNGETLSAEQVTVLEANLLAANEALGKSLLFEETGTNRVEKSNGVIDKVNKAIEEVRKEKPQISNSDAMAEVFMQHPDWYNEYSRKMTVRVGSGE